MQFAHQQTYAETKSIGLEILEMKLKLIVSGNLARKESSIKKADEKQSASDEGDLGSE